MARNAISIDLQGLKELESALLALDRQVSARIGRKAVRDSAQLLRAVLAVSAPYRPGSRRKRGRDDGHLREILKVVSVRAKKPGLILYRVSTGDAFWGNFLELGTVKMNPRPWMRPTVEAMKGELVAEQVAILKTGIDRAAKRAARGARPASSGESVMRETEGA